MALLQLTTFPFTFIFEMVDTSVMRGCKKEDMESCLMWLLLLSLVVTLLGLDQHVASSGDGRVLFCCLNPLYPRH